MKTIKKLVFLSAALACGIRAEPYKLDSIRVVIFSEESTEIITDSDLERPGLEGSPRTQDDIILEKLIFADAKKFKITPDEQAVDRHLMSVQKENNLTLDQLKAVFRSAGYSYEERRAQFAVMTTINSMLDFKIRSRLMIPEKEVLAYYNEHPETEEAEYQLSIAFVPYADDRQAQQKKLTKLTNTALAALEWGDPFWIKHSELAEEKQFVTTLKAGEISEPQDTGQGFELYRMVDRKDERLKPLEDRYREIADILRKPRFDKLFQEYKKELFDHASLVYFD